MNKKLKKGLTTTMAAAMGLGVVIPAVPVIAAPATSGWVNTAAGWTYYKAGTKVASTWVSYNGAWYYIDANGIMATGWRSVGGAWYYMDGNGVMQKGWYKDSTGTWYYSNPSGDMVANKWVGNYYLGASGAMLANTLTPDNYFVNADGAWDGKPKYDVAAVEAAVAKAEASKKQADVDAAKALVSALPSVVQTAYTTRLNAIIVNLEVTSVSAINAKQVQVTFSKAVDETTAIDTANYLVRKSSDASYATVASLDATAQAELQADGKTVIITATNDLATNFGVNATAIFDFKVSGVKDVALSATVPDFVQSLRINDTTAPTFVSASASAKTSTNAVTLTFSEPVVATSGVVKVNGVAASVTAGSTPNTITATTGANLNAGSTYTLEVLNFTDFAGNMLAPSYLNTSVTVSSDVNSPVVSDVKVVRDNLVQVTFSKAINATTLTNSTVRLLDGNYSNIAATNITGITAADTTNKVFNIALDDTPAIPFNNGTFNGTLVFTDSIQDTLGNALVTTNRALTLTRDTVAPQVTSAKFVKADTTGATYGGVALTNGAIVVKYNEAVTAGTFIGTKIIDNNGTDVTATKLSGFGSAAVNTDDATELVIPLTATIATTDSISSLTLRLPAGAVNDKALDTNASAASVNTFTVTPGTDTTGDVLAPQITGITVGAANELQIAVTEASAIDTSTVLNLNNYRIDGAPLPSGTYATLTGTAPNFVIHLFLPTGSVSASKNYSVNVNGIKDTTGNTSVAYANNAVALVDDVKPVLTSAALNADGSVSLGYSESLISAVAAGDLVVTLNSKTVATSSLGITHVTAGAEAGKDVLVVKTSVDKGVDTAFGGGDDTLFIDTDATPGLSAGDIVLGTGSYTAASDGASYDLTKAVTLTVGTAGTTTTKDAANLNTLTTNTTITVK